MTSAEVQDLIDAGWRRHGHTWHNPFLLLDDPYEHEIPPATYDHRLLPKASR